VVGLKRIRFDLDTTWKDMLMINRLAALINCSSNVELAS